MKKMSPEVRQKISQSKKGKSLSQEHKDKISAAMAGRAVSDETKQKISATMRGNQNAAGKHNMKGKSNEGST